VKIDKTDPTISGAPTAAANGYGWYNSNVTVHFAASDAVSGVDTLTPDVVLSGEGAGQSVIGTAVDAAGNSASFTVTGVNIDLTRPVLAIASPASGSYANTDTFSVVWAANDALSGIATQTATLNGTPVVNGQVIDVLLLAGGVHDVTVKVTDKAGNVTSSSVSFAVAVTIDGLLAALQHVCALNWVSSQGVCTSLEASVKTAQVLISKGSIKPAKTQLDAFVLELDAQNGKFVNQPAYDLLKTDALYVKSHL
jgi:hypothetical protein